MASYEFDLPPLVEAFRMLQDRESASGCWGLGGTELPFADALQDRFPLAGRFLNERGRAAVSRLPPEQAVDAFGGVFG
jgi:hypothetical protein